MGALGGMAKRPFPPSCTYISIIYYIDYVKDQLNIGLLVKSICEARGSTVEVHCVFTESRGRQTIVRIHHNSGRRCDGLKRRSWRVARRPSKFTLHLFLSRFKRYA